MLTVLDIGPVFFDEITATDGAVRQLQWTARVEGGHGIKGNSKSSSKKLESRTDSASDTMVLSQYLGRGSTSRGRITITSGLTMTVSDPPFLKTADDKAAVIEGIKHLQTALAKDSKITWLYPTTNQTIEDFVDAVRIEPAPRR